MEYLKKILKNNIIEDIYLIGFVDIENGIAQFYHDLRFVYFEINSQYIEFECINNFSKLKIKIVDSIKQNYEIDDDMIRAKSSINEIILSDTMANGNDIDNIIFYNIEEKDDIICDALQIELVNGQVIFLDPTYYFGINIGGIEQKQAWYDNIDNNKKICETKINISDR